MSSIGLDALRSVPIFAALPAEDLERVAALATEFEVRSGHVLVEPGQAPTGVFIIEEGVVTIELVSGREVERGPGAFFGELAILADTVRSARVSAKGDVRCLAIRRDDLMALLQDQPTMAIAMLREVAKRLIEATANP